MSAYILVDRKDAARARIVLSSSRDADRQFFYNIEAPCTEDLPLALRGGRVGIKMVKTIEVAGVSIRVVLWKEAS